MRMIEIQKIVFLVGFAALLLISAVPILVSVDAVVVSDYDIDVDSTTTESMEHNGVIYIEEA